MLVIDASALAVALLDEGAAGTRARVRLNDEQLVAPELIDLEVASVMRKQVLAGVLARRRAELLLIDLVDLPLMRAPHAPLLQRAWELRENLTVYDASYVALAERLDVTLLTTDKHLARATGPRCQIDVLR